MEKELNAFLADLAIEARKIQLYHWYVKGPDFFQAHQQLEHYYDEVNELVDDVAEGMLMCGMKPLATMKGFLDAAELDEATADFVTSKEAYAALGKDFGHLLESAKNLKSKAEGAGADLLAIKADGYIEYFSKATWMLAQR